LACLWGQTHRSVAEVVAAVMGGVVSWLVYRDVPDTDPRWVNTYELEHFGPRRRGLVGYTDGAYRIAPCPEPAGTAVPQYRADGRQRDPETGI
jgi:hypothetical protein